MYMKTKGRMTQCPIIHRPFWPKNAKVRDNRGKIRVFLKGNARIVGREAEKVDACKHGAELSRRPATFSRPSRSMCPATPYAPAAGPVLRVLSPWGRGPEISRGKPSPPALGAPSLVPRATFPAMADLRPVGGDSGLRETPGRSAELVFNSAARTRISQPAVTVLGLPKVGGFRLLELRRRNMVLEGGVEPP